MTDKYIPWKNNNRTVNKDLRTPKYRQRVVLDKHKEEVENDRLTDKEKELDVRES